MHACIVIGLQQFDADHCGTYSLVALYCRKIDCMPAGSGKICSTTMYARIVAAQHVMSSVHATGVQSNNAHCCMLMLKLALRLY